MSTKAYSHLQSVVDQVRDNIVAEMAGKKEFSVRCYLDMLQQVSSAISKEGYVTTSYDLVYDSEEYLFPQVVPHLEGLGGAINLLNMLAYLIVQESGKEMFRDALMHSNLNEEVSYVRGL